MLCLLVLRLQWFGLIVADAYGLDFVLCLGWVAWWFKLFGLVCGHLGFCWWLTVGGVCLWL